MLAGDPVSVAAGNSGARRGPGKEFRSASFLFRFAFLKPLAGSGFSFTMSINRLMLRPRDQPHSNRLGWMQLRFVKRAMFAPSNNP